MESILELGLIFEKEVWVLGMLIVTGMSLFLESFDVQS